MALQVDPKAVFSQLIAGYLKLPLFQKIIFPLLILGSVSAIIYVSRLATQPDYTILYSDLPTSDASAVVERLKALKMKYRIDGTSISISPAESVHELRMTLASEGIPKSGTVGFELFDGTSFGTTTFSEVVKKQRALQGELERTIMSLDAVQTARVHISQPEKSIFTNKNQEPTASVLLRMRSGGELEKKQIRGIANFVAGSLEGLKAENVTIIDVYGNLLTPKSEDGDDVGPEATRLMYVREIEKGYIQRIEQMLTKVLGPGKVVARVTADMDFSLNEREEESYDSGGQVIRSERTVEEGVGSKDRGGVPGVVSNLSNDPKLIAPQGGSDQANHKENVKNYEVSRAVIKSVQPRGKLTRLSAAVLVDGTYDVIQPASTGDKTKDAAAKATKVFKPLAPEVIAQVEGLVKSAVGFDNARGDTVTVENIPFFEPDESLAEQLDKAANLEYIIRILQYASPILAVMLFFFVIVKPLVRFLVTPTEAEVDLSRLLPTGIQELEQELESERTKAALPEFEPSVDMEQLSEILSENSRIVKENPQQAALLIRYWLNDGRL